MSNVPTYTTNGHSAQQYASAYSSTPTPLSYHAPHASMSQPPYAYYHQQTYGQNIQLQQTPSLGAATLHPLPFQGYPAHPGHAHVAQLQNATHLPPSSYSPHQQQEYAGYASAYPPSSSQSYSQYPQQGHGHPSAHAHQRDSTSSTMSSSSSPSPPSQSPTERFPCPNCEKTFTRNFDRKRHMEIHVPGSSGSNRCRYCLKEYSRPDSLKRHLDNGCEKKPHS